MRGSFSLSDSMKYSGPSAIFLSFFAKCSIFFLVIFHFWGGGWLESEIEIGIEVSEDMRVFGLVMGIGKVDVRCGLACEGLGLMEWVGLSRCKAWSDGIVGISLCSSFWLVCGL